MKRFVYNCDMCGKEITDVAYSLTCYAEDVSAQEFGGRLSAEVVDQNVKQNLALGDDRTQKILCKECKDAITDGLFIV